MNMPVVFIYFAGLDCKSEKDWNSTVKILCVFGEYNYGEVTRGTSYEYANFIPSLRKLGHTVVHFETWNRGNHRSFADLNQAFLETVERFRPDAIFCVLMHYELWLEVLEAVGRRCTLIHWGTDDSWKYEQFSRWAAPTFHLHATTVAEVIQQAKHDGLSNLFLTQWAASSVTLAEPLPASKCQYAVTFIGTAYGNRPRFVAGLKERGIEVVCFGHGWPRGSVKSEDIPRILRNSAISLNFGDSGIHLGKFGLYRSRQIKARVFEIVGAGGCLLTENAPHLSDYFVPGEEIVVFDGAADLEEKISYLLSHPAQRDAIAQAGYERTVREHTYEKRFCRLLENAAEMRASSISDTIRDYHFDQQWFSGLRSKHKMNGFLKLVRFALVALFSAIFGSRRGARAARRFVYELSWRFCGKKTFSAAGVPGRMFYRES